MSRLPRNGVDLTRRHLLFGLSGFSANAILRSGKVQVDAKPKYDRYPFTLGVASGSPGPSSVVLWTRLAPEPLAPNGGLEPIAVPVRWIIANTTDLSGVVQRGVQWALPQHAHSLHVTVRGLAPGTRYWYQFYSGGIASKVGATKTLPQCLRRDSSIRFATVCCQNFTHGYFSAYDDICEEMPDFIVHLGDYIYDTSFGVSVRSHETTRPLQTIADFRRRHALYKLDPSLARAHRNLPFFVTLDNHDAAPDRSEEYRKVRVAACKAWYEHMPVRSACGLQFIELGGLAKMALPETRRFRDPESVCLESAEEEFGYGMYRKACPSLRQKQRSLLGIQQENRLERFFLSKRAIWNVLLSSVPFTPFDIGRKNDKYIYVSSWDAYPAARDRFFAFVEKSGIDNFVVVSGDIHSSWLMDLRDNQIRPQTTYGAEIITTSISSRWPDALADPMTASVSLNPQIRFHDVLHRGYVLHSLTRKYWNAQIKWINDVEVPASPVRRAANAVIRSNVPGISDVS